MYFCNSVKNNYLGIKIAFKSNEKKKKRERYVCKIKCTVSIIKITFLVAYRNISAASSRVKNGDSSYLPVFEFSNVSLQHLENLISCEWGLCYHPSHPFCAGSSLILLITAQTYKMTVV